MRTTVIRSRNIVDYNAKRSIIQLEILICPTLFPLITPEKPYISLRNEASGLSHFSRFPMRWNGLEFPTSEHACRAAMFMWSSPKAVLEVLHAPSPLAAIELSKRYVRSQRPEWDSIRIHEVREICGSKLIQHSGIVRELLDTGDLPIVLDVQDTFWGIGKNWDGRNEAGNVWMQLRSILRGA